MPHQIHPAAAAAFARHGGRPSPRAQAPVPIFGAQRPATDTDPGPSPFLSVAVHGAARATTDATESTLVADLAERLGLTRDASEEDVLTALEALDSKQASARIAGPQKSAEDNAFDRVFGRASTSPVPAPAPAPLALTDDEAFKRVFGR